MVINQILTLARYALTTTFVVFIIYKTGQMLEPVPAIGPAQNIPAALTTEAALPVINDETMITVINSVTGENETLSKYT
jgi:hypothetical protein